MILVIIFLFGVAPVLAWMFRLGADVALDAKLEEEAKRLREAAEKKKA